MSTPVPFDGLEDIQRHFRKTDLSTSADAEKLEMHLEAATEAAEAWKNTGPIVTRQFVERVKARRGWLRLLKTPVVEIDSLTRVDTEDEIDGEDVDFDPVSGIVTGMSVSIPPGVWEATYSAGRGAVGEVPASYKLAVLIIAEHIWELQRGPNTRQFRGQASSDEMTSHKSGVGYLIPNRAAHLLRAAEEVMVG